MREQVLVSGRFAAAIEKAKKDMPDWEEQSLEVLGTQEHPEGFRYTLSRKIKEQS